MLIEEHKNGSASIEIYDDFIRSKKESEDILERVADKMLFQLYMQRTMKEKDKPTC